MEASTLSKSSNTDGNTKKANKKVLELFGLTVGPFFARFSQSWRAKSDITITCFAVGGSMFHQFWADPRCQVNSSQVPQITPGLQNLTRWTLDLVALRTTTCVTSTSDSVASSVARTPHCPYWDKRSPKCKHQLKCKMYNCQYTSLQWYGATLGWKQLKQGSLSSKSATFEWSVDTFPFYCQNREIAGTAEFEVSITNA